LVTSKHVENEKTDNNGENQNMILSLNSSSSSYYFFFYLQSSISHNSLTKLSFPIHSHKTPSSSLSLNATPTPLFLPFLEQQEREEKQQQQKQQRQRQQQQQQLNIEPKLEEEEEEEEEEDDEEEEEKQVYDDPDDPIYKFFKTRTMVSSQNPEKEAKLLLQNNRRSTWKLASQQDEMGMEEISSLDEDNEEMGSQKKEPSFPEGVVGEIVQIARNLSQNLTLEEALGEYDKRVNEKECLEVMEILGNENLVVCCLYFFQWMRSHEPSLVTPRAFTVLFPLLGKARMGDKLLVLFRNLPSSKEFRNVRVYNAAISGLLSDGR
jgi:hypothetical protein